MRLWKQDFWSDTVQKRLFWICVAGVFVLMFLLNFFTPLIADDYSYSLHRVTREPISSITDILESQYAHYFSWGGRNVVHFLAQLFLWIGKPFFTVINTFAYTAFSLVLYKHASCGAKRKYQPFLYLLINLDIWFLMPVFGQTTLWLVGSCNYLWGSLIILSFLLPYRTYLEHGPGKMDKVMIPLWLIFGVLAGWCNENTSGMAVMLTILFLILHKVQQKRIPIWGITGLVGVAAGFIIMIAAPGNYARNDLFNEGQSLIRRLLDGFETCTGVLWENLLLPCLIFIALYVVLLYGKGSAAFKLIPLVYFCGGLACNYAMMLSPIYPYRAEFGCISALIVACGSCITSTAKAFPRFSGNQTVKAGLSSLLGCLVFIFCFSYGTALSDIAVTWRASEVRADYIEEQKAEGNYNVVVSQITPKTSYNPLYGLEDIQPDPNHWVNAAAARYFGLESIKSE